jgi:hypothetical protein
MGAVWAGRALVHAGSAAYATAIDAPPAAQVAALRDTSIIVAGLVGAGLALGIWGVLEERRARSAATLTPHPSP